MTKIKALGIMSGTSMDGVDFVVASVSEKDLRTTFSGAKSFRFPSALRKRLVRAASGEANSWETGRLHHDLGRFYAACARKLPVGLKRGLKVAGLHGQTIFHESGVATLQIGEPSYLAAELGVDVVSDFRTKDIALGGKGAPLATYFHRSLLSDLPRNEPVAVQNIGGIGNLSYFDERRGRRVALSFDTGPGNMLMDLAMRLHHRGEYDADGRLAAKGVPSMKLVLKMLVHPYFKKSPPKSCGREEFGEAFLKKWKRGLLPLSQEDRLATLCELTALSMARAYASLPSPPKKIFICGGGARNPQLLFRLRYHAPNTEIVSVEELGWDPQMIEGGAFAQLATAFILGKSAHFPKTTGARRSGILGKFTKSI